MKRTLFLLLLALLVCTGTTAKSKKNNLSGTMALKGVLKKEFKEMPARSDVTLCGVYKDGNGGKVRYHVEMDGTRYALSEKEMAYVYLYPPQTEAEFWQQVYLKHHLYGHYSRKKPRASLRREVEAECADYLHNLEEIAYPDTHLTAYVQDVFAGLIPSEEGPMKQQPGSVRLIQSPDPECFMLPNGTLILSSGLLCTLDSEDELAAIMAGELSHFILDHQVQNIARAEKRAKRSIFWAGLLSGVAYEAMNVAYWDDDKEAFAVGAVAGVASIATLISISNIDRFGMTYKTEQEAKADRLAHDLLTFKGYNPDGLASALTKISDHFTRKEETKRIPRYDSTKLLKKRILTVGMQGNDLPTDRGYLRTTCEAVSFNAGMNLANGCHREAAALIEKNIRNHFETDNDLVLLTKAEMALSNSEAANTRCLSLLERAQELAGSSPNLDIYKQRILLLMRMNRQTEAAEVLQTYLSLLSTYQQQEVDEEEKQWSRKEAAWANQLLEKIYKI